MDPFRPVSRIEPLEGLRGLLALWVVIAHVLALAGMGVGWRGPFKLLTNGTHAVDVFIILSGFVIFLLIDRRRETYGRFIWRRFWRLFPSYVACSALMIAFTPLVIPVLQAWPIEHPLNASRLQIMEDTLDHLGAHVAAHLPMLHAAIPPEILPNSAYAILGQAWSISLEWQFYLLAPAVFAALRGGARPLAIVVGLAAAVHFAIPAYEGFLPRHVPYFAVGIASYFLLARAERPTIPDLPVVAAALAYFATHDVALVLWAAVFAAIYRPDARGAALLNAALSASPFRWLGKISYSVYLFHAIAMYLAMMIVARFGEPTSSIGTFLALLAITVTGTLAGAAILYRFLEAPGIRLGSALR
ncbi:MAG: acyltransferase [Alphaproteobacteria bacterium]|nr:acyltransferase [Alphaproteobacteria bacterium]